jgi:hypothetical protein
MPGKPVGRRLTDRGQGRFALPNGYKRTAGRSNFERALGDARMDHLELPSK